MSADLVSRLRLELASRVVRSMGPRSPFWNCTICGAAHLTPIAFQHKPGCLIEDEHPPAIINGGGPRAHYSIEVEHAIMRDALIAIASENAGTHGQAAQAALDRASVSLPSMDGYNDLRAFVARLAETKREYVGEMPFQLHARLDAIVDQARKFIP